MTPQVQFPTQFPIAEISYLYTYFSQKQGDIRTVAECFLTVAAFGAGQYFKPEVQAMMEEMKALAPRDAGSDGTAKFLDKLDFVTIMKLLDLMRQAMELFANKK